VTVEVAGLAATIRTRGGVSREVLILALIGCPSS
jgi:hypothetical protein